MQGKRGKYIEKDGQRAEKSTLTFILSSVYLKITITELQKRNTNYVDTHELKYFKNQA